MPVSKVWHLSEEDDALVLELWIGVMKDSGLQRMTVSFRDYSNRVNFHPTAKFSDLLDIELQRKACLIGKLTKLLLQIERAEKDVSDKHLTSWLEKLTPPSEISLAAVGLMNFTDWTMFHLQDCTRILQVGITEDEFRLDFFKRTKVALCEAIEILNSAS